MNAGPTEGSSVYSAGDVIQFKGGEAFTGTLVVDSNHYPNGVDASERILFTSYGSGRATIQPPDNASHGIHITNLGGFEIAHLDFDGMNDCPADGWFGILVEATDSNPVATVTHTYFRIHDVTVQEYCGGISFTYKANLQSDHDQDDQPDGDVANRGYLGDIAIENSIIRDNGSESNTVPTSHRNGIELDPNGWNGTNRPTAFRNVTVKNNTVTGNGVFGIYTGSCGGPAMCLVDGNTVDGNGTSDAAGGTGIYMEGASNAVVQNNTVSRQQACPDSVHPGDCGGIDVTGIGNLVQYNYTYENSSYGYWFDCCYADDGGGPVHNSDGIVRYNVSQNDGVDHHVAGGIWIYDSVTGYEVYNNTVYGSNSPPLQIQIGSSPSSSNIAEFYNNIFYAKDQPIIGAFGPPESIDESNLMFERNVYYQVETGGPDDDIEWEDNGYATASDWVSTFSNFETVGTVRQSAPGLAGPNLDTAGDKDAFKLDSAAASIDDGLDLVGGSYVANVGDCDGWLNSITSLTSFDIGAHEFERDGTPCGGGSGPQLQNGDFETGDLSPWANYNPAAVASVGGGGEQQNGDWGLHVPAPAGGSASGVSQTFAVDNGSYTVSCWLRAGSASDAIEVAAEGYGDVYVSDSTNATDWDLRQVNVTVTTEQITILIFRPDGVSGAGDAYADDCTIT